LQKKSLPSCIGFFRSLYKQVEKQKHFDEEYKK